MLKSKLNILGIISFLAILGFFLVEKFQIDLLVSGSIHEHYGWRKGKEAFWFFLYEWGPIPSILAGLGCLLFWLYKLVTKEGKNINSALLLFPFMTLVVGPGILVNILGKELWGRPRPANCIEMGGLNSYQSVLTVNPLSPHKSFPSGHAATGFHLCTLSILFRKKWRSASFCIFLIWGTLISIARILQGGHFVSDIIGSIVIVILTSIALYPRKYLNPNSENSP